MLGIANRGRKILLGETAFASLANHKVHLLLVASDASENTKKKCLDKSSYYKIDLIECGSKKEFGQTFGKGLVGVVGISDKNIAEKIKNITKVGD